MHFLQFADFAAHLSDCFIVDIEGQGAEFTLVEAAPLGVPVARGAVRDAFSLIFRNAAAVVFPQRTYTIRHASMGEFGIFLVPVAQDRDGFLYQAVFN